MTPLSTYQARGHYMGVFQTGSSSLWQVQALEASFIVSIVSIGFPLKVSIFGGLYYLSDELWRFI